MLSILFVEDDPIMLANVRRVLAIMRRTWDTRFAMNATEALAILAENPVDVVVADLSLPDLPGVALLAEIRHLHPNVVRVALLETLDTDTALRASGVAHRFLRKPFDPAELSVVMQRTFELEQRLTDPDLLAVLGRIGALPSPSATVLQLNDLLQQPDTEVDAVARVIETDMGMTAKVLQVVNSAYFGLSHHISDVREAVSYLGLETVRNLTVALELMASFATPPAIVQSFVDDIHEHSLAVAYLARELVRDRSRAGEAFVAALLHDVGLLVVATHMPERFVELRMQTMRSNLPLTEVELEVVGAHHADIGAHLLDLWGLPSEIVEAVARHHDAADIPANLVDTIQAVYIADAMVSGREESGDAAWEHQGELDPEYMERVGVDPEMFQSRSSNS